MDENGIGRTLTCIGLRPLDDETAHKIRVIPPDRREIAFEVESETDLQRAIVMILRMRIPDECEKEIPDDIAVDEPEEAVQEEVAILIAMIPHTLLLVRLHHLHHSCF